MQPVYNYCSDKPDSDVDFILAACIMLSTSASVATTLTRTGSSECRRALPSLAASTQNSQDQLIIEADQ